MTKVRRSMMFAQLTRLAHKLSESHDKVFLNFLKQGWPKQRCHKREKVVVDVTERA